MAFVATIYGVGSANLLYLPVAGKMKLRIREEQIAREMTLEGVASILEGMNPRMLETKLLGFLVEAGEPVKPAEEGHADEPAQSARARTPITNAGWFPMPTSSPSCLRFFVVLYASAQVDHRKVGRLAMAIQVAFQELGVFPDSETRIPLDSNEPMPFSTVQVIENAKHNTELGRIASPPENTLTSASQEANLTTLQTELQQALRHEIAQHTVALHREADGLVISLREFGFFDSGSAALKPSALPALDRIASILAIRTCVLRIEGHTDNIPIHTPQMASNWELSTARSTELVRLLIVRYGFPPERLSAAGYAEYHPIASNDTVQGRAQNRRVDVVILTEHAISENVLAEARPSKPSPSIP